MGGGLIAQGSEPWEGRGGGGEVGFEWAELDAYRTRRLDRALTRESFSMSFTDSPRQRAFCAACFWVLYGTPRVREQLRVERDQRRVCWL